LEIIVGRRADRFHDKENGIVGKQAGEGVGADSLFAVEYGAPKNPRDEKRHGTKEGTEKVVPAVGKLALKPDGKDGGKSSE
jgi:hypothetical protein